MARVHEQISTRAGGEAGALKWDPTMVLALRILVVLGIGDGS